MPIGYGGLVYNLRREVRPVTLTFYIGEFRITITVKKRGSRHSAK